MYRHKAPERDTVPYRIKSIELYVRETPPGRMIFSLGKKGSTGRPKQAITNPLGHVRMIVADDEGNETFGCAADRLSVRWLDKRPGRDRVQKLQELVDLIEVAREVHLAEKTFKTPFEMWQACHPVIMKAGQAANQVDLTSSMASSLMERAVVDAVCRLEKQSVFQMVKSDRLGFRPASVHSELKPDLFQLAMPPRPMTRFFIRHTVGLSDPLTASEIPAASRINDGLPEALDEYLKRDGVRFFKVKISGDVEADLARLEKLWQIVLTSPEPPAITLDANEAYDNLDALQHFVTRLERDHIGVFQHILYIEQPLPRALTMDRSTAKSIRRISEAKPLVIDEADGTVHSFKYAHAIGYRGTSHKNCKGFFKSLLNRALVLHHSLNGEDVMLSAEDLQNLPVVPLHQDFATLGILGLEHCERNGHHYNFGLSFLSDADKKNVVRHHSDMYETRNGEAFLRIKNGSVECGSLQCPGFGVRDEPNWKSMVQMKSWMKEFAARS